MAIAFDAKTTGFNNTGGANATWSHTVTGSNTILFVAGGLDDLSQTLSCTYNSLAMTQVAMVTGASRIMYLWVYIGPATGAHNVVLSRSSTGNSLQGIAVSYTGAKQSGQPDSTPSTGTTSANTTTITTGANNDWVIAFVEGIAGGNVSGVTNLALRQVAPLNTFVAVLDSNAAITPAGSTTATWAYSGSPFEWGWIVASFAPVPPPQPVSGFFMAAAR